MRTSTLRYPSSDSSAERALAERAHDLYRENARHALSQHCGLITRSRADLEHTIRRFGVQQLGHERDDEGLRDRLPFTDRQRSIGIGERLLRGRNEAMARNGGDRLTNPGA
jgi:hypothetical protein